MNLPADDVFCLGEAPDARVRESFGRIRRVRSLVAPLVAFADVRKRPHYEAPRSIAAATLGHIVPELTPPTLGCAMTLIKTPLTQNNFTSVQFEDLVRAVTSERPSSTISHEEFMRRLVNEPVLAGEQVHSVANILPKAALDRVGNVGFDTLSGNHFIGCYVVERVDDASAAARFGVGEGQLVFAFHAEGGGVPFVLGRYFGARLKFTFKEKVRLFFPKLYFHLRAGLGGMPTRLSYYFVQRWHDIPADSAEGKRLMLANNVALAASALHHKTLASRIIAKVGGEVLWSAPHYTIGKEHIGGREVVVHRSGSHRALPNEPMALIGHEDCVSYLCQGPKTPAERLWHSAPYAYGALVRRAIYNKQPIAMHPQGHTTARYDGTQLRARTVPQVSDATGERVLGELVEQGALMPVAVLRPLYVYFGGR